MQIVYHAAHSADAQLVHGLLAQEGIRAFVFGAALEAGAGLLPVGGAVRLEVADQDAERARQIIEAWQETEIPPGPDDDEGDRPTDELDDGDETPADTAGYVEDANLYRPIGQRKPRRHGAGAGVIVLCLAIGAALGATATAFALRPGVSEQPADYDADGIADERLIFEGQTLVRIEADRNTDSQTDQVSHYDPRGLVTEVEEDQDFNGVRETVTTFRDGQFTGLTTDYSGDGAPERQQTALRGVLRTEEWFDPQGRVIKRDHWTGGRLTSGEIDSDGDGALDTQRQYDERHEVRTARRLPAP
ncbi:DUF2007 domain-containing protein [Lysobacter sp. BMK333-48F3]|uniref:putative signal transducing protein n=1 Tax=Lysobacter sp. BMK333-48F3 TaxID=2867962 RepID=UPI001C8C4C03|nr:DUF2007 domain-containing protein [Lysobacter sp. BMK333-48F3]MBX9401439.1 DUF2007 domain-containing protein [Lysobacter sp. BMK333-48F3]